jgi:hypothetical protein
MGLLLLEKLKKDINILFGYVRCLMAKSDENCPLVATEWSNNHSTVLGNAYTAGTYVFYNGHVYKCLFNNDGILPTNTTYWLDLGEGHLLAEEQTDWNATGGRRYIVNKPTNTSDFVNDGENGSSPYVTQDELNNSLPDLQNLDEVLAEGDQAPTRGAYIQEIGFWDNFSAPFGYAKIYADKGRLWFQDKLGVVMASIRDNAIAFKTGIYEYTINVPNATANRIATFQNKSGVVAYLSDISEATSTEVVYEIEGGTTGTQPTFTGAPLFSGSYVKIGNLVHFQIQVDMDNITNFGTGQFYLKLPFESKYGYMFREGCLHDFNTGREYHISGHVYANSDTIKLFTSDTQGNNLYDFPFTATEPVTLNSADNFHIAGTYIANS